MTSLWKISCLTFRNRLIEEFRYPLQFILNTVSFITIIILLSLGSSVIIKGTSLETGTGALFMAFLAGAGFQAPTKVLAQSKLRLQEFYLRPLNSLQYLFAVSLGYAIETIITLSTFMLIIILILRQDLELPLRLLIIGFPVYMYMFGMGLALAGFRLIYQKIQTLSQFVWFVVFGAAIGASPVLLTKLSTWSVFASGLLYIRSGTANVYPIIIGALASILIGAIVFRFCEKIMLRRGLIGLD